MTELSLRLGPFDCVHELRSGASATLYVARLHGLEGFEKIVAVKRIHDHVAQDPEFVRRFVSEAQLGASLGHANIVRVLECGADDFSGAYYIASEFVDGISVQQLLTSLDRRGRRFPAETAAALVAGVADALDYAHQHTDELGQRQGICHGALRPSKILLPREGGVKVLDFGVADALSYAKRSAPDTDWSHCAYIAPETVQRGEIRPAADLFALGAIFYELVTAEPLFLRGTAAETLNAVQAARVPRHAALSPGLEVIVRELVAPEPSLRPATAADVHDALAEWLATQRMTPAMAWSRARADLADVLADWPPALKSRALSAEWEEDSMASVEQRMRRQAVTVRVPKQAGLRAATSAGYEEEERTREYLPTVSDPYDPIHALDRAEAPESVPWLPPVTEEPTTELSSWEPGEEYTDELIYDSPPSHPMARPMEAEAAEEEDEPTLPVETPLDSLGPSRSERVVDVVAALEGHLRTRPGDRELRTHLGGLYRMQDRLEEAERMLCSVVDEDPAHSQAWYHLGLVFQRTQRFADAEDAWNRAVHHDPTLLDARLALANLQLREGHVNKAVLELTDALATDWQCGRAHHLLVICYHRLGDREGALQHLDYAEEYGEDMSRLRERLQLG